MLNFEFDEALMAARRFSNAPISYRRNSDLTDAVIRGAYAAEVQFATARDCPYERMSIWCWAWRTGFDLGRRIDEGFKLSLDLEAALQRCRTALHLVDVFVVERMDAGKRREDLQKIVHTAIARADRALKEATTNAN